MSDAVTAALKVLISTLHIRWYLSAHDPKALEQAEHALRDAEQSCPSTTNPFISRCGAKFDTYEERHVHELVCPRFKSS